MHIARILAFTLCFGLAAQEAPPGKKASYHPKLITEFPVTEAAPLDLTAATELAVKGLMQLYEGDNNDEWPYEGVYREDRGNLPVGYRIGGTSIVCLGMIAAPGYPRDEARQAAVEKGLKFVLGALEHDRMSKAFIGGYDVRGWGHIYALQMLLHLTDQEFVPKELAAEVKKKTAWLVGALVESAIPTAGGWNYSRRAGYPSPNNRASTFMTPAALQALFHAKARGHGVPDGVVNEALAALDRARSKEGGYGYGAAQGSRNDVADAELGMMDKTPGSAARATICESTLLLAGRGDLARLQSAIDRFFEHWDDLAVRKSQRGTHIKPYGIAPYYFLFGHVYAAQAIELLPDGGLRQEYRARMQKVLARSREDDGTWNDRQFARSAGYGTAMALLTMHMSRLPKPAKWRPDADK